MPQAVSNIVNPAVVADEPTITDDPGDRRVEACWPLRSLHSDYDGEGVEYVVLSVFHLPSRRAYVSSLNREERFSSCTRVKPFDAARVGSPIPVARFGQKSLQAAFDDALAALRQEIAAGDQTLASYFTPSEGEAF